MCSAARSGAVPPRTSRPASMFLADAGLGQVGAGDEEDAPVGDCQLGVHLRTRFGALR